ncbi:MAG: glycerol-3-phosphate 1-O-acyltransferase PlsY [Motiliproteus sp.]
MQIPVELATSDLLMLTAAYLLGSVSSAVLVCQLLQLPDPRNAGSQNPGATNVWRTGSHRAGFITLLADILKGALPVFLAQQLQFAPDTIALSALAAMLGHLFPIYSRFRGGKGVATFIGSCITLEPLLALYQIVLWLLLIKLFRRSSLASICTALTTVPLCYLLSPANLAVLSLMALLVIGRHHRNIRQLLQGTETSL